MLICFIILNFFLAGRGGGGVETETMVKNGDDTTLICIIHLCFKDNGVLK